MQYEFEKHLANNEMHVSVADARRFARAIRSAMRSLEQEAMCYRLTNEPYYRDVQAFLEEKATRLEAEVCKE